VNIAVLSAFRDCSWKHITRYFHQVRSLQDYLPHDNITCYAVEGDSINDTAGMIQSAAKSHLISLSLSHYHHGYPNWGSVESSERMSALTGVMKALMSSVDPKDEDVCLYVESDLIWEADTASRLIRLATYHERFNVFAPLIMAGENFYDVWAFRDIDGNRFGPFHPFCKYLNEYFDLLLEVNSVGSCLAFRSSLAHNVNVEGEECLVSWCNSARKQGYRIAVDPTLIVRHP